jgi:hypothetical protein
VRNALAQRAAQHRAGSSDGLVEHAEALRALA